MRDLMIDIETLGSRPGSVILSIGAVSFDAETGQMGDEFYMAIDAENAAASGLTTDVATMIWWMKQSEEARHAAFSGTTSLRFALLDLGAFVERSKASRIWAKPPSFDLVLLEAAFRACGMLAPWHFRTHRDCRTIFDLTDTKQPDVGTAHNALDDAKGQALGVIDAYSKLRGTLPPQVMLPELNDEQIQKLRQLIENTPPGRLQAATEPLHSAAINACRLHAAYEATPADRGGKDGRKGKAWAAFIEARNAALQALAPDERSET